MQTTNRLKNRAILGGKFLALGALHRGLHLKLGEVRKELVKWRVDQTNRHLPAIDHAKHVFKVSKLEAF